MKHPASHLLDAVLRPDLFAHVESRARRADVAPSPAQADAGNYRKGRLSLQGLDIAIENPRGSVRSGVAPDGTAWSNTMAAHYGYIGGTRGADGDEVDVFIGPLPESGAAWVVNQRDPRTGAFDEHKVMLGFSDEDQARDAYQLSYDREWDGLMSIVPLSLSQLRRWLASGDMSGPLAADQLTKDAVMLDKVMWTTEGEPSGVDWASVVYGLRRHDDGGLMLDAVTQADIEGDPEVQGEVMLLDALVIEAGRLKNKMLAIERIFNAAGSSVKVTKYTIANPVKYRGVLQVAVIFDLSDGQTVTIWFHNAESSPSRLSPADELISWRWLLNKLDVTIVVAPERGRDLNIRDVARRIMKLADKNAERFAQANAKLVELAQQHENIDTEIAALTVELSDLERKIEVAKIDREEADEREAAQAKADAAREEAERAKAEQDAAEAAAQEAARTAEEAEKQAREAQEQAAQPVAATEGAGTLPPGWKEGFPGGIATNTDAKLGGIVDKNPKLGKWFIIFNDDDIPKDERWFETRADAFAAFADALRSQQAKAEPAAQPAWRHQDFEPTSAAGYAQINGNDEALKFWQDRLDSFFGGRIVDVRNALRERGWDGEKYGDLTKDGRRLVLDLKQTGAGRNVVGVTYRVMHGQDMQGEVFDDLSLAADDVASKVDGFVPAPAEQTEAAEPKPVAVAGNELGEFPDTVEGKKELRAVAMAVYDAMLGESVPCPAIGADVSLRKSGMNKVKSLSGDSKKLKLIPAIKDLLANSTLLQKKPPYDPAETSIRAYYVLRCAAQIGEESILVRTIVKEDDKGSFHWDLTVHAPDSILDSASHKEKGPDFSGPVSVTTTNGGAGQTGANHFARHQLAGSLLDDASGVNLGSEVLNLFIEGEVESEEPSEVVAPEAPVTAADLGQALQDIEFVPKGSMTCVRDIDGAPGYYMVRYSRGWVTLSARGDDLERYDLDEYVGAAGLQSLIDSMRARIMDFELDGDRAGSEPETNNSPTDAELQAAAKAGAKITTISYNLALPKAERDALPLANFATEDRSVSVTLWTKDDLNRAKRAQDDAREQADFEPFEAGKIRMPTAVQLRLNAINGLILTKAADGEGFEPGWSNGHMLDLASRPKLIEDAIKKYFVDSKGVRQITHDAMMRVVNQAKSRASVLTPEAFCALYGKNAKGKQIRTMGGSVVLINEEKGFAVTVNTFYFSYFFKTYKGCQFLGSEDPGASVAVRFKGQIVGVIMPINGQSERAFARAIKASRPEEVAQETNPVAIVDAAYKFDAATDRFKDYIAETVDETDYSMFVTCKAMDEAAKSVGAAVSWDIESVQLLDSVDGAQAEPLSGGFGFDLLDAADDESLMIVGRITKGGDLIGRALVGGDGKAMVYVGADGSQRVKFESGTTAGWSDDDAALMVRALVTVPQTDVVEQEQPTVAEVVPVDADAPPAAESSAAEPDPTPAAVESPAAPDDEIEQEVDSYEVTPEEYKQIAATIYAQMGGARLKAMTGARDFMSLSKGSGAPFGGLQFSLPSGLAANGINRVLIKLNGEDTYDMEFARSRGISWNSVETVGGVYADGLQETFTRVTGLDTSLGSAAPKSTPARVTKKAANEAYDSLQFSVSDLRGHLDVELMRVDVPARLTPKIEAVKSLQAAGWPEDVADPSSLIDAANDLIARWQRLKDDGLTRDMGRGEAELYLRTVKGLTPDQVDAILAKPSSVDVVNVGGSTVDRPSYTMDYLNSAADAASTSEPSQAPEVAEPSAAKKAANAVDLTYKQVDDMFTAFYPETEAGKVAWNEMAKEDGRAKVLNQHVGDAIAQLRAAGYRVAKKSGTPLPNLSDDELLADLAPAAGGSESSDAVQDRAFLHSLIDGTADMLDEGIADRLETMLERYADNPEMAALLTSAANAYSDAVMKAAQEAMAPA